MTITVFALFLLFQTPAQRLDDVKEKLKHLNQPAVVAEMIDLADHDADAAVRRAIVDRLGRLSSAPVAALLERRATADADTDVALLALERLRQLRARELGTLFDKRLASAHASNDAKALNVLVDQHQRWASYAKGAILPDFLAQPPAVFSVTTKPAIRVLAFGDFGEPGQRQTDSARAAADYHRAHPFDFGITLGDNVTPVGVTGPGDARWQGGWCDIYDLLHIPIYAVTGNHDWGLADSPAAEILYSQKSPSWRMPALYYTFTAGPVQFFALATQAMSETQLRWLQRELDRSTARWKVVYGHHPIYSDGAHGDTPELARQLMPVLKGRADLYLVGHEHTVQELKPDGTLHMLVAPSAGQKARVIKAGPRTLALDSFEGFIAFDITAGTLSATFVDSTGKTRYTTAYKRQ